MFGGPDRPCSSVGSLTSAVSDEATVAEAFLRMFVETCGHYDSYISVQQNGEKIFQVHVVAVLTKNFRIETVRLTFIVMRHFAV